MGYDKKDLQTPVSLEKFTKDLPGRFAAGEFKDARVDRVERELEGFNLALKKQWTFWKKAGVTTAAIAASFLLFVGSGFVSPTMAKMVSKIPPLSAMFDNHEQELTERLTQALKKDGYPVKQVNQYVGGKNEGIMVHLDASEKQVKEMEPGVKKIGLSIVQAEEFKGTRIEDYFIKVRKYHEPSEKWKQEQAEMEKESEEVFEIVQAALKPFDFKHSIGFSSDSVELEIPSVEKQEKVDEIQKAVKDALAANGKNNIEVKIRKFNLAKREQYARWSDAVSGIGHEFMTYKKYKVSGVGYKSSDGFMTIYITMKMKSTDEGAADHATDLYTMAEEFIKSDDIWPHVKQDPYKIVVRTKDKKEFVNDDGQKGFR
ncbi:DUF4030 domain-containing protein [Bacillus sp. ISL-35]|uniref:DUF4179 domain-containing protein n=1 Tax=Bacillus sp. ISL-35 TaxID=2819122 RepID=UPI001BE9F442|nr:DUF4179 domain-containing protein [Bacillus sp. ISL-35]MBT2681746.1 DUF4030 domain-containing protein [Bacillus sp. ISL-35]MBT2706043.1 DUF4030 domain-containing protein [Chryseobacterium sp. ISL-80]